MSTSDWVALIGLGVAVIAAVISTVAMLDGRRSRKIAQAGEASAGTAEGIAREANQIAAEARDLAASADERSSRQEARATEQHDVTWELIETNDDGVRALRNRGTHTARSVRALVSVANREARVEAEVVEGGQRITVEIPGLRELVHDEQVQHDRAKRRAASSPYGSAPPMPPWHLTEFRVDWLTDTGAPREQEPDPSRGPLIDY